MIKFFKNGLFLTIVLSLIVLEVFYGKLLNHCNSVYFGDSSDALQSYYTALFHLDFDKSCFHNSGMNYPYGENIFFAGGHIPVIMFLQLVNHIVNISGCAIGIINLSMLLSIMLCAISIYLIFREFSLPPAYSSIVAVCIAFLSPQVHRLGGTLSYDFFIPGFMYLMIRFYHNPTIKKSILIGLFTLLGITAHIYFFLFFCFISSFFWMVLFFSREKNFAKISFVIKHFLLQIILPYVILNIIFYFTDQSIDRTQYPWGFFDFMCSWAGVLFPFGKPYENLAHLIYKSPIAPSWEGITYLGVIGIISFLF